MDDKWRYDSARDLGLSDAERARSVRREVGLLTTLMTTLRWAVVRCYLRVFHRLRVEGRERLPKGLPIILVANHSSHLDALTLGVGAVGRAEPTRISGRCRGSFF